MHILRRHLGLGLVVTLACCSAAIADTLPTDPHALAAWQGTEPFVETAFGFTLSASVDYAVYAPGQFQQTFGTTALSDSSDYVYAYQIYNGPGQIAVQAFTVGLADFGTHPQDKQVANIGYVPNLSDSSSVAPPAGSYSFQPGTVPETSALWNFSPLNNLPALGNSDVLFFTSPYPPELDSSTIQSSLPIIQESLPSPVPEPATGILLAIAATFFLAVRIYCARTRAIGPCP